MTSNITRGRAQLRDLSPAEGLYEVDYVIQSSTQTIRNVGAATATHNALSAQIRLLNGYVLRNGNYCLENDGEVLYKLEKSGAIWRVITGKA